MLWLDLYFRIHITRRMEFRITQCVWMLFLLNLQMYKTTFKLFVIWILYNLSTASEWISLISFSHKVKIIIWKTTRETIYFYFRSPFTVSTLFVTAFFVYRHLFSSPTLPLRHPARSEPRTTYTCPVCLLLIPWFLVIIVYYFVYNVLAVMKQCFVLYSYHAYHARRRQTGAVFPCVLYTILQ